jgi:hypothetical protein
VQVRTPTRVGRRAWPLLAVLGEEGGRMTALNDTQGEVLPQMDAAEARMRTDEVKDDAERLWAKLLYLYQNGAHVALGYSSWGAYYEAEFGQSGRHGYRLLEAAKVVAELPSDQLVTESTARELAPVLDEEPGEVGEVWSEVTDRYGDRPTAAQAREVVKRHRDRSTPAVETETPGACSRKLGRARQPCGKPVLAGFSTCKGCTAYLALSKFEPKCRRFEAAYRETKRLLIEDVGWSDSFTTRKLREVYGAARDGLDGEGVES